MLKILQEELPKIWTDELYSKEFKASPSCYKDFQHGLLHIMKAAGKLLEMVEESDHHDPRGRFEGSAKFIADLVICAVRLAIKNPDGAIDLEKAVLDRIHRKMGVKLEIVVSCPECDVALKCNHHDSMGRCQCSGELGPCCKCS